VIDVASRLSAVRDDAGDIVGMSGITRDLTAETRIRAALMASEHRFRARFEQTQVPQATLALDGTLVAVNDACACSSDAAGPSSKGSRFGNVALLREADGVPYWVGVFIQDLSELRRAERARPDARRCSRRWSGRPRTGRW
jgi:hypothetical protein